MLQFFAALNRLGLTPQRFTQLLQFFENDVQAIWRAPKSAWQVAGLTEKALEILWPKKLKIDPDREFANLTKIGVRVLPITAAEYPQLLREIHDPPPVLLVRGNLPQYFAHFALAVVGPRVPTPYGRQVTNEIVGDLARAGLTIISGLALGIDALAHTATLQAGGQTLAVLGNGIETVYPVQNQGLGQKIVAAGGAIISEYPPGTLPAAYNFPQRNRIIAGLARGVLIVEARRKSGSLITAKLALEENRDVFAVPGSIFAETSAGTNNLISATGAKLITCAAEIFETLNLQNSVSQKVLQQITPASKKEDLLLKILTKDSQSIEHLIKLSKLPADKVTATLSFLELKGLVKNFGGSMWARC